MWEVSAASRCRGAGRSISESLPSRSSLLIFIKISLKRILATTTSVTGTIYVRGKKSMNNVNPYHVKLRTKVNYCRSCISQHGQHDARQYMNEDLWWKNIQCQVTLAQRSGHEENSNYDKRQQRFSHANNLDPLKADHGPRDPRPGQWSSAPTAARENQRMQQVLLQRKKLQLLRTVALVSNMNVT